MYAEILAIHAFKVTWNRLMRKLELPKLRQVHHCFGCENNVAKRDLAKRRYGKIVSHMFVNVLGLSANTAWDDLHLVLQWLNRSGCCKPFNGLADLGPWTPDSGQWTCDLCLRSKRCSSRWNMAPQKSQCCLGPATLRNSKCEGEVDPNLELQVPSVMPTSETEPNRIAKGQPLQSTQ